MSIRHIAAVADLPNLSSACKSILFCIAIDANCDGWAPLDRRTLPARAGMSERSLRTHLTWLRANNYIDINEVCGSQVLLDFGV